MELTITQKLLIYGLTLFPLEEQDQEAIFLVLKTQEQQEEMVAFLMLHPEASGQEVLNEMGRIIKKTLKKQDE